MLILRCISHDTSHIIIKSFGGVNQLRSQHSLTQKKNIPNTPITPASFSHIATFSSLVIIICYSISIASHAQYAIVLGLTFVDPATTTCALLFNLNSSAKQLRAFFYSMFCLPASQLSIIDFR